MTEQTYMKLQDKVIRPKLTKENINRENKQFKRLVDQYIRWCTDGGGYEDPRETYEKEIIGCLFEFDLDGYQLAEHLKDKLCINPNSELVEILDYASYVKDSLTNELVYQWIKENFLEIPNDVVGKKVSAKQGFKKYENHYITTIKPETYEVTISEDHNKKGGWVIGYENVTIL